MTATLDLLCGSLARLSGPTQLRLLSDHLPLMTEEEQIALASHLAAALQPHLVRPLFDALSARIAVELDGSEARLPPEEALEIALESLRRTAALLLQNAEGCAVLHHGAQTNDLPGWLKDCRRDVERAAQILNSTGGDK